MTGQIAPPSHDSGVVHQNVDPPEHVGRASDYQPSLDTVVRCRGCGAVLMVFVQIRDVTCVDLHGLASLTPA